MKSSEILARGLEIAGIELASVVIEKELEYLDELLRWNKKINLTAIVDYTEAIEKHLIDSLYLVKYLPEEQIILDIGSGGGLPGVPLALARPDLKILSVDSSGKKINFQKHIRRLLQLENFTPIACRAENIPEQINTENIDFVIARAFTSLERLIELSAPLLAFQGCLLAMKGPEGTRELDEVEEVAKENDFSLKEVLKYKLPFSLAERHFIVLKKGCI